MVASEMRDGEEYGLVWAEGALTIEEAAEFKDALSSILASHAGITIDLEKVAEIDITCIQLLFSVFKSCRSADKGVTIKGMSKAVIDAMEAGGFKCPWIKGGKTDRISGGCRVQENNDC